MSKARGQSITRKNRRVGNASNITGIVIKDLPNSTKMAKSSSDNVLVVRTKKFVVNLTKKESLRRFYLAKRKLKLAS